MIARCAEHAWPQVVEGHVIRKTVDVQFGVAMTVWIAAAAERVATPVGSHVGQRHGLIVKQLIRDRPGHAALKRGLSGSALVSGSVVFRGTALEAPAPGCRPQRRCPKETAPCKGTFWFSPGLRDDLKPNG